MKAAKIMLSQWHVFHTRKRTPFYVDLYTQGIAYSRRNILNFSYHAKFYHINGKVTLTEAEWTMRVRQMQKRLEKDPQFLIKVMNAHYQEYRRLLPFWHNIRKMASAYLTNRECARFLMDYGDAIREFWTPGLVPLYGEEYLTNVIEQFVHSKFKGEDASRVVQIFMTPKKEGVIGEEYRSLLKVAMLPTTKREKALERHSQRFAWMANQLFTHTFFPCSYYRRRVVELSKKNPRKLLSDYFYERNAHLRAYQHWMETLAPDQRMKIRIESLNEAIFYRSWRGEKPYESEWIVKDFIHGIAKRLKLPPQDLLFCTVGEIVRWLTNGQAVSSSVIDARKNGFIYLPVRGGSILTGRAVAQWERKIKEKTKGVKELKGVTAFPGVVHGNVRIVHGAAEFSKIRQGDVLITGSTTPLYVPILGKVRAIVTEEGGVLSHASVISREMKIPCIIGTKIATKVFKDGDMVEVDAVTGIVRKL